MNAGRKKSVSLQTELIRKMQADTGQTPCYATPISNNCNKKEFECAWRHDCFHEAEMEDAAFNGK